MSLCWLFGHSWVHARGGLPACSTCGRYWYRGKAIRVLHGPVLRVLTATAQRVVERSS